MLRSMFGAAVARLSIVALATGLLLDLPAPAYAHPDFDLVNSTVEVPPGRFVEFPMSVHFHRLVGRYEVLSPGEARIIMRVMDEVSFVGYKAGGPASEVFSTGNVASGTVNFLIACCGDDPWSPEPRWDPYHLVVEASEQSAPVAIRLRLKLIHDDQAVVLYNGEGLFITAQAIVPFAGLAITMAVFTVRRARRRVGPPDQSSAQERRATRLSLQSAALLVVASAAGLSGGLVGMRSYGGSVMEGSVALLADLPFALQSGWRLPVFLLWFIGLVLWLRSFSAAAPRGSRLAGTVGVFEGLGALGLGLLLMVGYGSPLLSLGLPALVGVPQMVGGAYLLQKAR